MRMRSRFVCAAILGLGSMQRFPYALLEKKDDKEASDLLASMAKKGQDAFNNMDPSYKKRAKDMLPDSLFEDLSKKAHEAMQTGAPGQIGYGFMMGYSSGYCLKKISKLLAFGVGGFFIITQTMAYNGYITVNQDKVKTQVEQAMDLNRDGKVDMKDAELAYDKLHTVLSYNMPTGGGFSAGLLMGLRS